MPAANVAVKSTALDAPWRSHSISTTAALLPTPTPSSSVDSRGRLGRLVESKRRVQEQHGGGTLKTPWLASSLAAVPRTPPATRRVVAVMRNIGSLYEEMARQLVATGVWESVAVKQPRGKVQLVVSTTGTNLDHKFFSLLLGEKIPAEKYIAHRRLLSSSSQKRKTTQTRESGANRVVVNYVENMRCITLKGSMVSTLLAHHNQSWDELGKYFPLTFRLLPRQPRRDDRDVLLSTLRPKGNRGTFWIAKSSSGCHGNNVEIFSGTPSGVEEMLDFIDNQRDHYMWVVQLYIHRPLLYHRRKFDVRCWVLLRGDSFEIYLHEQLVMRMSSVEYSSSNIATRTERGRLAHITNHCVQATGNAYSTFEEGNELWREHLDSVVRFKGHRLEEKGITHDGANPTLEPSFKNTILPQLEYIIVDSLLAARPSVPRPSSAMHCFQVFGYDFIIDEMLRVWLLEINGAPGVAERILPEIVTDTIEVALRPFFHELPHSKSKRQQKGYVQIYP